MPPVNRVPASESGTGQAGYLGAVKGPQALAHEPVVATAEVGEPTNTVGDGPAPLL